MKLSTYEVTQKASSVLPEDVRCATWGFDVQQYVDQYEEMAHKGYGLYIEGDTRAATMANAVAQHLMEQGVSVISERPEELIGAIEKGYEMGDDDCIEAVKARSEVDVLVLTGFGETKFGEPGLEILYNIICRRYEDMRPTIIATPYTPQELIKAIKPRGSDAAMEWAMVTRLQDTTYTLTVA